MTVHPASTHAEGLRAARLLMVLSSISPLFILWAIRGNSLIPDRWLIGFCTVMVVVLDRRRYEVSLVKEKSEQYRAAARTKIKE